LVEILIKIAPLRVVRVGGGVFCFAPPTPPAASNSIAEILALRPLLLKRALLI
jgi:hypothetical protein